MFAVSTCPNCSAWMGRAPFTAHYRCRSCGFQAPYQKPIRQPLSTRRLPGPPPENVRVWRELGGTVIEYRWPPLSDSQLLLLLGAFGVSVLLFWLILTSSDSSSCLAVVVLALLLPLLFSHMLANWINRTRISTRKDRLLVVHGPLGSYRQNQDLPRAEIARLYCLERTQPSKRGTPVLYYDLLAEMQDGRRVELIGSLTSLAVALCLQDQLETCFNLPADPIDSVPEYRRGRSMVNLSSIVTERRPAPSQMDSSHARE